MGPLQLTQRLSHNTPRARTDPLAWTAVGLGAVACCPLAALGGFLTGILSLIRIRRSAGLLGGTRVAWLGVALSLVIGATSLLVAERIQAAQLTGNVSDIRSAVEQTLGGGLDASAWWIPDTHAGLPDFQREMSALLAPIKVGATTQTETLVGNPPMGRFRLVVQTRSGDAIASVEALLITDWNTWLPGPRLQSIEIAMPRGTAETSSDSAQSSDLATVRFPRVDHHEAGATLPRDG